MPKRDNSDVLSGRPSSTPSRGGVTKTQTSDSEKPRHARCIENSDVVAFDKESFHNAVAFDNLGSFIDTNSAPPKNYSGANGVIAIDHVLCLCRESNLSLVLSCAVGYWHLEFCDRKPIYCPQVSCVVSV